MSEYTQFLISVICTLGDPVTESEYANAVRHLKEVRLEELSGEEDGVEYD